MTKVDIFSGFLGAGKTTLIKKLIAEAYTGQKLVLIENEFGEIGIDGGFMKESGIQVNELNAGCICCSLVGDFTKALQQVVEQYHPDRILIEPAGVGKLSDIMLAVSEVPGMELNATVAVADASKCELYTRVFGEFYDDQIRTAGAIVLSRTDTLSHEAIEKCIALLRARNATATIITTPWTQLEGKKILEAIEGTDTLAKELEELKAHAHDDDDDDDDDECCCHHHHHDDDDDDHDHEHHHHHHDDDDHDHEHHHHDHDHDDHEHHHHHHHHHHHGEHDADEVFTSWGVETPKKFTEAEVRACLEALSDREKYGFVLRAKGIVDGGDGAWLHFDYVPGEIDVRRGTSEVTGRLCVIGSELREDAVAALFGV